MDLIDVKEAKRAIMEQTVMPDWCKTLACYVLSEMPTVDAEPVRHAEWISMPNPNWPAHTHDMCSLCGWWNTKNAVCKGEKNKSIPLKYCPNCKAKMDLKDGEQDE